MKSLSQLCELTLMRNYQQILDVANVPYRLIKRILLKVKFEQLCKLEKSNVLLVFEDDELWLNLLKQDFPTSTHESYVSKKAMIRQYYTEFVLENDPSLLTSDQELFEIRMQSLLKKNPANGQFRIPYRMLYFRYQEDVIQKQEKSAERLRLQMKQLQQEREKNQIVVVDPSFYAKNQPRRNLKEQHSDLFRKTIKEHGSRLRHFKNGGFDIAKRHSTRVAFGGSAGGAVVASSISTSPRAGVTGVRPTPATKPDSEPKPKSSSPPVSTVKKRRAEPPSIFLNRKKPTLSVAKEPRKERTPPNQLPSSTASSPKKPPVGHKKKSALFNTSSQQHFITEDTTIQTHPVYIFDKRDRPTRSRPSK